MEEEWRVIQGFPNYIVSNFGEIINEDTGRVIRQSRNSAGIYKVGLHRDGSQHTRSVKVIVADAFVEGRTEVFNTPVQLDNDASNLKADNLVWRPRWFAWKYHKQFEDRYLEAYQRKIGYVNLDTGQTYDSIFEIAITHGVMMDKVFECCVKKGVNDFVFPQWYSFAKLVDVVNAKR